MVTWNLKRPGMSQRRVESDLQQLDGFENPKLSLEQYNTPPGFAAELLHVIDMEVGLSGKSVLDLGCGCGILGLGCVRCGASKLVGIDIDEEALTIAKRNRDEAGLKSENIHFLQGDIRSLLKEDLPVGLRTFDIVVSNPPFGIWGDSIDLLFVTKGLEFSDVVYSFHKSSTHDFLVTKTKEMQGICVDFVFENKNFTIPHTYGFHKFREHDVMVDVAKFIRKC